MKTWLIILAFLSLGLSAVFLNMDPAKEMVLLGKNVFPRTAGIFCITLGVIIYFVGRVLGVILTFKKSSQ